MAEAPVLSGAPTMVVRPPSSVVSVGGFWWLRMWRFEYEDQVSSNVEEGEPTHCGRAASRASAGARLPPLPLPCLPFLPPAAPLVVVDAMLLPASEAPDAPSGGNMPFLPFVADAICAGVTCSQHLCEKMWCSIRLT